MPRTSTQHIELARSGNENAFRELVKDWYPRIYNYSLKFFAKDHKYGSPHDQAMEVTQKTFISVHRNLRQLDNLNRFKPWLYRIATNYCYEEERRQKKHLFSRIDDMDLDAPADASMKENKSPETNFQKGELKTWLMKALAEINEDQRIVIIMKEYEGLKFREIAEALQISENTAKSRLYYGLKGMRKILENWNISPEYLRYEI